MLFAAACRLRIEGSETGKDIQSILKHQYVPVHMRSLRRCLASCGAALCQAQVIRCVGVSSFPWRRSDAARTVGTDYFLMTRQMWHSACVAADQIKHTSADCSSEPDVNPHRFIVFTREPECNRRTAGQLIGSPLCTDPTK